MAAVPDERAFPQNTIVQVKNFGPYMTKEYIKQMFDKYGRISAYGIMNAHIASERFAYIAFEDSDAADEAVIELNGQKMEDERRIRVRRTRKKEKKSVKPPVPREDKENYGVAEPSGGVNGTLRKQGGFAVHVSNLDVHVTSLELKAIFSQYGAIIWAKIIIGPRGSRGYGFVTFFKEEDAKMAIKKMSGRLIKTQLVKVQMARGPSKKPQRDAWDASP